MAKNIIAIKHYKGQEGMNQKEYYQERSKRRVQVTIQMAYVV